MASCTTAWRFSDFWFSYLLLFRNTPDVWDGLCMVRIIGHARFDLPVAGLQEYEHILAVQTRSLR